MNDIRSGQAVPDFSVASTGGTFRLSEQRGQHLVLFFYPRANTPGCTQEAQDFRDLAPDFAKANTSIVGISRDTLSAQTRFKEKLQLPFELLADPDEQICQLFDVMRERTMYGRKVMSIERSTFLIDGNGILRQEWRKVRVANHAATVLEACRKL